MSDSVKIEFWGGLGEYGRVCFYVDYCESILLDCGIHKGTLEAPAFNNEKVKNLKYVFLTHSHIDHYGALDKLYDIGYKGKVYMTKETSLHIQNYLEKNKKIEVEFIDNICPPLVWHKFSKSVEILWGRNGHVQGAFWIALKLNNKVVFYSGDYNDEGYFIPHNLPYDKLNTIDIGIIDAGNGYEDKGYEEILKEIKKTVEGALIKGGNVLFPAHVYGKSLELLIRLCMEFKNARFIINEELYKETCKIKKLDLLNSNIEIIGKNFSLSDIDEGNNIIFSRNIESNMVVEVEILNKIKNQQKSLIIFSNKQSKASIGEYMVNNKEEFLADIRLISIKSHQSLNQAMKMAKKMNVKKRIFFHYEF